MSNDTIPARIWKKDCSDLEPYECWLIRPYPESVEYIRVDLVDALIEAIGNAGGRSCPMCYAIGGEGEFHDDDCVNGKAIAAIQKGEDE
jgi:hypothetical protein